MDAESQKWRGKQWRKRAGGGAASSAYFLGFIATLVYYLQHSSNFWLVVTSFIKACLWPGFLVYHLLEFLGR